MIDDTHVYLKYAIIKRAVDDYKRALIYHNKSRIIYFERWFLSEWGEFLSGGNGAYIIEQVRKEVKQC